MTLFASETCKRSVITSVNWEDIMVGHVRLSEVTIVSKLKNKIAIFVLCERKHGRTTSIVLNPSIHPSS